MRHRRCTVTRPVSRLSFHAEGTTPSPALLFHVPKDWWPRGGVARTARSDPDWLSVNHRIRSAAFFLVTQQAAFDASWMHLRPETLLDQTHQFRGSHRRLFLACLADECQDLVGQLVRLFGAAFVGHQT